ncbi:hypothetical protein [Phenylobacterium sp.]|uniref:hypothetical protein n=1 Tax=Phenylobacterium sp. TaxID=1871053 RepID=UPI00286C4BC8|nr:hypothetical protein [Phenylobacterium sp.]
MRLRTPIRNAVLALVLALAAPVAAQEADPIAALLEQPSADPPPLATAPAADPETADAVAAEPAVTPVPGPIPAPAPPAPRPPQVYMPPPQPPGLSAPTHVDETGRSPEAPPSTVDLSYEARMRSSFASAQGLQGPLDGAWTLRGAGVALYTLQLVDTGLGTLEGAWRDPRRRGATDSSGFLALIQRNGGELAVSFYPRPGVGVATLQLNQTGDGSWSGYLEEAGERRSVILRRD